MGSPEKHRKRALCISDGCRRLARVWGRCHEHKNRTSVTLTLAAMVRQGKAVVAVGPDGVRRYALANGCDRG